MHQVLRGRYTIIKLLGSGGFGETHLAEDGDLPGKPICVVKRLQPRSNSPAVLQIAKRLFNSEAEVLYRLGNHNQIPRLFAHFEENQQFYLVQEFIEGHDLSKEITPGKRWNEANVVDFLEDVLKTLEFVHQQNVIHRDVKPANLIRRKQDSKIVLIDFGAVKEIQTLAVNTQGQTHSTIVVGTRGYMPNEQQGGKPRFSSDIYAVGMTAIQALTGVVPDKLPEDAATGEIMWRQQAQVSDRLAAILDKMVRSHFRDRYQSAALVLNDLGNLYTSVAAPVVSQVPNQQPVAAPVVSPRKRQRFALSAIALLIPVAVGVPLGISQLFSSTKPVSQPTVTQATPEVSPTISATPVASIPPSPSPAAAQSPSPSPAESPVASSTSLAQAQNTVSLTESKCLTTSASSSDESFVKLSNDITIGQEVVTPVAALSGTGNAILGSTPAGVACLIAPPNSTSQFRTLKLAFGINNRNEYTGNASDGTQVKLTVYLDKKNIGSKKVIRGQQQYWKFDVSNVQDVALEAECLKTKDKYTDRCPAIVFTQADLE